MQHSELKNRIEQILETFDMGAKAAAKAMNITPGTFAKKRSDKVENHCFNEKNLQDLIHYIKQEAEKL